MKVMWKEVVLAILRMDLKVQGWLWLAGSQEGSRKWTVRETFPKRSNHQASDTKTAL